MADRISDSLPEEREEMLGIFNYYVEHSFATYTDERVDTQRFEALMSFAAGWPTVTSRDQDGRMTGFGLLRPYSSIPAFSGTAELTCFVDPSFTGQGIGAAILERLEAVARGLGLRTIVATISSLNEGSIRFHASHGFVESGRLLQVGMKHGSSFDLLFFQKMIH